MGCLVIVFKYGGGTHADGIEQMKTAANWVVAEEIFYLVTIIFLKLSLGVFFLRICVKKWQKYLIYAVMVVNTAMNIFDAFFLTFMCGKPGNFLLAGLEGKCLPNRVLVSIAYQQGAVTTSTDFIFALLPTTILWNANMDRRTKSVCAFVLSLGAFGSICSCVRFKYLSGLGISPEFFWNAANISIWSTIELGAGIVAGSLATLRPLFKRIFYSARHSWTHATTNAKRYSQAIVQRRASSRRGTFASHTDSFTSHSSPTPWENPTKSGVMASHAASCYKADEMKEEPVHMQEKKVHLIHVMHDHRQSLNHMWSSDPEKHAGWGYQQPSAGPGPGEIQKVVDVEVEVLRQVDGSRESFASASSDDKSADEKSFSSSPSSQRDLVARPAPVLHRPAVQQPVVRPVASSEALRDWRGSWLDIDVEDQPPRPATHSEMRRSR